MAQYAVSLFAGGNPFWCVDEEHRLRDWIDKGGPSRFTPRESLPTVKTTSLDSSTTTLELRWTGIDAVSAWQAVSQAIAVIEDQFPDVIGASFMRAEASLQTEADSRGGRWTKSARARR